VQNDLDTASSEDERDRLMDEGGHPFLMGKVAAVVQEKKPAKDIVDEMVGEAARRIQAGSAMLTQLPKL
jgi:hypothetical protein